jgi:hypothetical protein
MDNPIPSASDPTPSTTAAQGQSNDDKNFEDYDNDEDSAALAAHITKMGGDPSKASDVEAKSVKCTDVSGQLGHLEWARISY